MYGFGLEFANVLTYIPSHNQIQFHPQFNKDNHRMFNLKTCSVPH